MLLLQILNEKQEEQKNDKRRMYLEACKLQIYFNYGGEGMNWREISWVLIGGLIIVIASSIFFNQIRDEFATPSGKAYGWAIGVVVVLLIGIVGISSVFSFLRRRDELKEQIAVIFTTGTVKDQMMGSEGVGKKAL